MLGSAPSIPPVVKVDRVCTSGRLVAWAGSWLGGEISLDEAVDEIAAGAGHDVTGLPDDAAPAPLGWALGQLRVLGVRRLRLVRPVPGDVVGLTDPVAFRTAALGAGEAVLAVGGSAAYGLVPEVERHLSPYDGELTSVHWQVHTLAGEPTYPVPSVADADFDLRAAVRAAARELAALDIARWRPELADALADLRASARCGPRLPPGYPPRATPLLGLADTIARIIELASAADGAAVSATEAACRSGVLRELGRCARWAQVAAYDAYPVAARQR